MERHAIATDQAPAALGSGPVVTAGTPVRWPETAEVDPTVHTIQTSVEISVQALAGPAAAVAGMSSMAASTVDAAVLLDVVRGVLSRCGGERWLVWPGEMWCSVSPRAGASRRQGWKLHVPATPLSAPLLLARCAEVLVRYECSFKFATDLARVAELVDPQQDRGASGKFITAYPRDDEHLRVVADALDRCTAGLAGPRILSDRQLRPGSLVHVRYGRFTGDTDVFTDDGLFESRMVGPDGSDVVDERQACFSPPPWAVWPFPEPVIPGTVSGGPRLLGGRYRMTSAIRHANRGGVFRAVDERDGGSVVIKQARAFVGARLDGSDMRDLLRHEARMLAQLAPMWLFPAVVGLFEEQGDLFLVEESVPGASLDRWVLDPDGEDLSTQLVTRIARELVRTVGRVHEQGLVLCDLKPSNIIITADRQVRLIDPEVVVADGDRQLRGYTPGFAAPELLSDAPGQVLRAAVDCFSVGATVFHLASGGLDPHWVSGREGTPRSRAERHRLLVELAAGRPPLALLAELIVGLTETDPDHRWTLHRAEMFLADLPSIPPGTASVVASGSRSMTGEVERLLTDGLRHLQQTMDLGGSELWRSGLPQLRHDPCDAWRGAAGVLAVLARAARALDDLSLRATLTDAASWIDERLTDIPRILPGLCFGRAGTAWALHEAGRTLNDQRLMTRAVELAGALPTSGAVPDVAFGLSGAGLARLHLWQRTADPELLHGAMAGADSVVEAVHRSGEDWLWPASVGAVGAGSHGVRYDSYGFAHGVAGVGMFLLAAAQSAADGPAEMTERAPRLMDAAVGAGDTLLRARQIHGGLALWPTTAGGDTVSRRAEQLHWCNGPAGIGTFLIRLATATGQDRYADIACQGVPAAADDWNASMGACCGLAGVGQFLLDLSEFTADSAFRERAEQIAAVMYAQAYTLDGLLITRRPETGCNYGDGTAGVLDFLLRLSHGGASPWLPDTRHLATTADPSQRDATGHQQPSAALPAADGVRTHETSRGGEQS